MNVTSSGIIDGVIQPNYGGQGTQFNENGIPTCSLPFTVEDAPKGTVRRAYKAGSSLRSFPAITAG